MNKKQLVAFEHLMRENDVNLQHMTKVGDQYMVCAINAESELFEVIIDGSGDWRRRAICDLIKKK